MVGKFIFVACCVAAFSAVTYAQDDPEYPSSIWNRLDTPFNFTDCAAPTEMETCWKAQDHTTEDDGDVGDVSCLGMQSRIECALTNCWNRVYSCDYQQLVVSYSNSCLLLFYEAERLNNTSFPDLPFYPAPADAAESCSCNLNDLGDDLIHGEAYSNCTDKVWLELDPDGIQQFATPGCDCCLYGAYAATIWDNCKDQDPGYIALNYINDYVIDDDFYGNNNSLAQCPSRLQNFNCADYGFGDFDKSISDYARPTPIHSATGTWSDTNGIITAPVSGATYTWSAWNATITVTAASVEAMATTTASSTAHMTSSGTGKDSGSATGSVTGSVTGSGSGASGTSTGAAPTLMAAQYPAAALMGLGGLAFALL